MKKRDINKRVILIFFILFILIVFYFVYINVVFKLTKEDKLYRDLPLSKSSFLEIKEIKLPKGSVKSWYPAYIDNPIREIIYSGDKLEIFADFSGFTIEDIKRIEAHGPVSFELDLKSVMEKSLVTGAIPYEVLSGNYEIKIFSNGNIYSADFYINGLSSDDLSERDRTDLSRDLEIGLSPIEKSPAILSQRHTNCPYGCYWEMAFAGNPINSNQLVLGALALGYIYSLDGGLSWKALQLVPLYDDMKKLDGKPLGFRGDPKLYIDSEGNAVLTGLQYARQVKPDGQLVYPTTGGIYTGKLSDGKLFGRLYKPVLPEYTSDLIVDRPTLQYDPIKKQVYIAATNSHYGPDYCRELDGKTVCEKSYGTLFVSTADYIYNTIDYPFIEIGTPKVNGFFISMTITPNAELRFISRSNEDLLYWSYWKVDPVTKSFQEIKGPAFVHPEIITSWANLCTDANPRLCEDFSRVRIDSYWLGPEIVMDKHPTSPYYGRVYVTWAEPSSIEERTVTDGGETKLYKVGVGYDLYFSYSDNDGVTWSSPRKINIDGISVADQSFPTFAVTEDGILHVAFFDKRNNPTASFYDVYYAPIKDGKVFANIKVNADPSCSTALTKSGCDAFMNGDYTCSWIYDVCRDSIPNPYGGRDPGDYMDYIVAYKDKVYISYPCMRAGYYGSRPQDACVASIDPRVIYQINVPPEFDSISEKSVVAGTAISFDVLARDLNGDSLILSASLSDGSLLSSIGASFVDLGGGKGRFSWTPIESKVGLYKILFNAKDGRGGEDNDIISIRVISSIAKTSCSECPPAPGAREAYCSREECESIQDPDGCYSIESGLPEVPYYCYDCSVATSCVAYSSDRVACDKNICGKGGNNGCFFYSSSCIDCIDKDSDNICEPVDNCPLTYNVDQIDNDFDGSGDACDAATCGDGNIYTPSGEECDDGLLHNSNVIADACRSNCKLPTCGDKVVDSGEQCDDGNTAIGDGCTIDCKLEEGWICFSNGAETVCKQTTICSDCLNLLDPTLCTRELCAAIPSPTGCFSYETGLPAVPLACVDCSAVSSCSAYRKDSISCEEDACGFGPCAIISSVCSKCSDSDNDKICDTKDNCPNVANANQADLDRDSLGDVCDCDADGDGYFVSKTGICSGTGEIDCNDGDANVNPGKTINCGIGACFRTIKMCLNGQLQTCTPGTPSSEVCNGLDDDCDDIADDGGNLDCSGGTPYCSGGKCVQCTSNVQCNDNNVCTDDICNNGICQNVNDNTNICDDNIFCNGAESCSAGSCINTPQVIEDGISCTTGSCDEINDKIIQTPDNTKCYDGLWCNGFEVCDLSLGCKAGTPVVCDDGIACTTNLCTEDFSTKDDIGQCAYPTTNCQCSTNAQCDDTNACTDDICNPDKTCSNINNDANSCNDNRYCTINDRCSAGNCASDSKSTDDGISCTDDSCDDATSTIIHTPINSRCDNGLYCDGTETCNVVQGCVAGTPIICSDPLSCTTDSCNENADSCSFTGIDNDGDSYSICVGANYDCDDSRTSIHPNAIELCNGIDEDCDGIKDEGCSCADFNGDICSNDELCPGTEIKGDGTLQRCCNVQCTLPRWNNCNECGVGLFNVCDRTECYSIAEGCSFEPGLFGIGTCNSCSNINSCEDYTNEQSCNDNKCSINPCTFVNSQCKNACIDIDSDGYGTGDTSLCLGVGIDCDESIVKGKDIYPNAPELCDGIDNQCLGDNGYGIIDEGCQTCGNTIKEGNEICDTDSIECSDRGYKGLQTCNGQCNGYGLCVATESCSDGTTQTAAGEQCDDGNNIDNDGCSALCKNEIIGSVPDLLVTSPGAKEYKNTLVPLEFIASNADSCYYVLDAVRKDTACNVNEVLSIRPFALNVPENHRINVFAVNANGQTTKSVDFSLIETRVYIARYDEFKSIGETTNLDDFDDLELESLELVLDDGIEGKIKFNEKLNLALEADLNKIVDLDSNVNIEHKKIEIKSDVLKGLNKKATLTFRNVGFNDPKIQKDGADCSAVDCIEVSYNKDNGIYVVDVSGFSIYTVVEGQQQQQPPPSDGGGPGGGGDGGGGGGGDVPPRRDGDDETKDNRTIDVIVINGTGEELERVEINQEQDTQNINIGDGTRLVLEVEGSEKGEVVDFSVEEGKVVLRVTSDNKEYEILGNEVVQLLLGGKDVYFGVKEITEGRAIVTLGLSRENVLKKIGGVGSRFIVYILIVVAVMLVSVIVGLIYRYIKVR